MVILPARPVVLVLGNTEYVTVPLLMPTPPEVMLTQLTSLIACQAQLGEDAILILSVPPFESNVLNVGEIT
jgi:hypothetical protein